MQTYQMSLATFTDNVIILAVENCLVKRIPSMFTTELLNDMDDQMVARLASETRKVRDERERYTEELRVLEEGLSICRRSGGTRI